MPLSDEYYEWKWPPALTEKNRIGRDLFSCQSVLAEIALHEQVVLYIQAGAPVSMLHERKALPPRTHKRYLYWSNMCARHYSESDRIQFWAQSLLKFPGNLLEAEPFGENELFVDILPPKSSVSQRPAVKQFGILISCTHATRGFCRLPVGLWQCYARRHQHNTEVWYREHFWDFDSVTRLKSCTDAHETGFVRNRNGSSTTEFLEAKQFNSLPYSSLCLIHFDALQDKWRSKRMAADVFARYEWHLVIDGGDVSIGPGCLNQNLEKVIAAAPRDAEVIVKDPSEGEDSNGGVFLVRRSPLGKLFLDLTLDKFSWPMQLSGSGCYFDQPSMNEALLETVAWEMGAEYNSECLPHMFLEPVADGHFMCNYMAHLLCFKSHLQRMAGPFGSRSSRKVFFMSPHRMADINFRPFGNIPDSSQAENSGFEPSWSVESFEWRPFLWHWVNYEAKRQVMLEHLGLSADSEMTLPPYVVRDQLENVSAWHHFARREAQWCQRHLSKHAGPQQCTLVSPSEACKHLKNRGHVRYC